MRECQRSPDRRRCPVRRERLSCAESWEGVLSAEIIEEQSVHSGWNRVAIVTVRTDRGSLLSRSVEDHGRASVVLPYDPERRVALLVRQLRVPLLVAGHDPMSLEAPAGLVEGDDPAACARREAMEEAGVRLGDLVALGSTHPMPGVSTEALHLFLAEYRMHDRIAAGGGLEDEQEEIEVVEMPLEELVSMADRGELADLKTFALVQTLRLRRPDLFELGAR